MQYAVDIPNFDAYADPRTVVALAVEAEAAGWDGFFVWDHLLLDRSRRMDIADPWVLLAAVASVTERIRIGPMVTPLPRRRPWQVARQAVTLDHLSAGRLILGVGLGNPADAEYGAFGEATDARIRAEKLDEALAILDGLWSGEPCSFDGRHYQLHEMTFLPRPVQRPRIPIWVAATWPRERPIARAARWDGVYPLKAAGRGGLADLASSDVRALCERIAALRPDGGPFDVVVGGATPAADRGLAATLVARFADAGATWWAEALSPVRGSLDEMRERIRVGPPKR